MNVNYKISREKFEPEPGFEPPKAQIMRFGLN